MISSQVFILEDLVLHFYFTESHVHVESRINTYVLVFFRCRN
jgi:hypothetical protein